MAQRGRRSLASQNVAYLPSASAKRPPPPSDLPPGAAQHWRQICKGLPPTHFTPADLSLLHALVLAAEQKAKADAMVQTEGLLLGDKAHPAIKISMQLAATMASLSVKLRLCQSTRTRADSANLRDAMAGGLVDPLAFTGE